VDGILQDSSEDGLQDNEAEDHDSQEDRTTTTTTTTTARTSVKSYVLYFGGGTEEETSGVKGPLSIWMGLRPPKRKEHEYQWFRKQTAGKWILTKRSDDMSYNPEWHTHQEEVAATWKKTDSYNRRMPYQMLAESIAGTTQEVTFLSSCPLLSCFPILLQSSSMLNPFTWE
jgi:hypothetical protein